MDKYLGALPEIRRIQDEITRRAKRDGIPIIEGTDIDVAVTQVLDLVLAAAERRASVS